LNISEKFKRKCTDGHSIRKSGSRTSNPKYQE
jgi:hypothetical protein